MSSFEAAVEYIRKSYRHDRRLDVSLKPVHVHLNTGIRAKCTGIQAN